MRGVSTKLSRPYGGNSTLPTERPTPERLAAIVRKHQMLVHGTPDCETCEVLAALDGAEEARDRHWTEEAQRSFEGVRGLDQMHEGGFNDPATFVIHEVWKRDPRVASLERRLGEARDALRKYHDWASRMPDVGFDSTSPRWQWWQQRPIVTAKAALKGQRGAQ